MAQALGWCHAAQSLEAKLHKVVGRMAALRTAY